MSNLTLFEIVLVFATISSAVIVFLLQRIIDSDSKWLHLAKTCLIDSGMLANILLKPGETIKELHKDRKENFKEWVKGLDKDMERFTNGNIAINDKNKYISPSLYDNIIDIMTASVLRLRNLIDKYFEGFVYVFGPASYTTNFYEIMLKRMKYKCHNWSKIAIMVLIICNIILLLLSFGHTLLINEDIMILQYITLWLTVLLAVFIQVILLVKVIKMTIKVIAIIK